jgi:hypothetical protein
MPKGLAGGYAPSGSNPMHRVAVRAISDLKAAGERTEQQQYSIAGTWVALIEIAYQVSTKSDENRFSELLLTAAVHLACGLDSWRYFHGDITDCSLTS